MNQSGVLIDADMDFHSVVPLIALLGLVLLKQVAEGQDRRLIRNPITDQIDAGKTTHGGHLNQGLFHSRVAERGPLLQQVDAQHRYQWIWRPPFLLV